MPKPLACNHPLEADRGQLYDILVSSLNDFVVFLLDTEGCIISWNPAVHRILGYSSEEWVGQPADIIFTPEDRAQRVPQKELSTALSHGTAADIRWHLRKDGSRLFVEGTMVALRDKADNILGFSKVLRDITLRKQREAQLQDAVDYAETIIDTIREPMVVLDGLRIRSANRSFYRTFQISQEETEGRLLYELANGEWNIPALHTLLGDILSKEVTVENFELEHDFRHLGRKVLLLNARKVQRDQNRSELTLLAFEDITERKQVERALAESEKRRRLIIDAVPAIISYVDRDLRYRLANDTYRRWFGADPVNVVGKTVASFFDPKTLSAIQPRLDAVLKGEMISFEESYPSPAGTRTLSMTYTPDLDEHNRVQGFVVLGSDISERKNAELALQKSEERWRTLFERMVEGFFIGELVFDSTGCAVDFLFLEVNPAFETLTGVSGATGKTVREAIPGIQDDLIQTYAQVVTTGEPAHFEINVAALNAAWYEVRARRTEPGCFAAVFLDITDRKAAEFRLRESETRQAALVVLGDRLRDLKDLPSLTSAAMEIVGTTLGVSRAGYGAVDSTGEFVTIDDDWVSGSISSVAGTYRFSDFGDDLGEYLQRSEIVNIPDVTTHPITARDAGRWTALDIRAVINLPLFENGKLSAILFIQDNKPRAWTEADIAFVRKAADRTWAAAERARALNELQANEEFTRSILASSPDCVKVISLDGRLLTMNEGGCVQMEIDNLAACVNKPWVDFWTQSASIAEDALAKARAGQTTRFEGFCPTAKGTDKWWEVVVTPVLDAFGEPFRILSLSRDITARKSVELDRERLTRDLQRSNEDLSQFAHTVAHDLQSPLRGVTSFAQLLQRNAGGRLLQKDLEFLNHIIVSGRRMGELVQGLLRFAQVGQGQIEKQRVEIDSVLTAALEVLRLSIEEQGGTIHRTNLPTLSGDAIQLGQLFQNLIGNALKYRHPDRAPVITVKATSERDHFLFTIADNGEGIGSEHLQTVFEPLKRLHGNDVPGTGLGLATCQRIVKRHSGRMWVESEPGVGSTFYFTLPAV